MNLFKPALFGALILVSNNICAQSIEYKPLNTNQELENRVLKYDLIVGKTPSSHNVSSTGAFNYNVPIRIPKGTNNMQPQVSLSYSSQGSNGVLGYGWGISGLSAISRSNKTLYHDGKVENVIFQQNDPMTLDGNRLVLIKGSYGHDGSIYKPESETFSKITAHGAIGNGAEWLEVETKQGLILEYGRTFDSRVYYGNGSQVIAWKINRSIDRDGNYIDYEYFEINKEHLVSKISYTGNSKNDQKPYAHINFHYQEREDDNLLYATEYGKDFHSRNLISKIDITYGPQNESYKRYELKYGMNIYSYLNEIIEYGKLGSIEQYNTLKFAYHEAGHKYKEIKTNITMGSYDYFPGDFNGDGRTDLLRAKKKQPLNPKVYLSYDLILKTDAGFSSAYPISANAGNVLQNSLNADIIIDKGLLYFNIGDFNGDGRMDIVTARAGKTPNNYHLADIEILFSNTIGTNVNFTKVGYTIPEFSKLGSRNAIIQGDFDGDGAMDLYCNFHDGHKKDFGVDEDNTYYPVIYSPRKSINPTSVFGIAQRESNKLSYLDYVYVLDMNGNGKSEIMILKEHSDENMTLVKEFLLDNSGHFVPEYLYLDDHGSVVNGNFPNREHVVKFADFNGDGKTDLMVSDNGDQIQWDLYLSWGRGFIKKADFDKDAIKYENHIQIADFNGDGKSDILQTRGSFSNGNSDIEIFYSKGVVNGNDIKFNGYLEIFSENISGVKPAILGDFDGDGDVEFLHASTINDDLLIGELSGDFKYGQLSNVSTGFNELIRVDYASIAKETDPCIGLYTPEHTAVYPIMDFHKPIHVVKSVSMPNGEGLNEKVNNRIKDRYFYKHAKMHIQGKGFLGFEFAQKDRQYIGGASSSIIVFSNEQYEIDIKYFFPRLKKSFQSIVHFGSGGDQSLCANTRSLGKNLISKEFEYSTIPLSNNRFINQLDNSIVGNNLTGYTLHSNYFFASSTSSINGNPDAITTIRASGTANAETVQVDLKYGKFGTHLPAAITDKTTTQKRGIEPAFIKKEVYDYDPLNGRLRNFKKLDPNGVNHVLEVNIEYHPIFGLPIKVSNNIKGNDKPIRESFINYDPLGRFITNKVNPLGYIESWEYDDLSGRKTSYDDILPNNKRALATYDNFHRTIMKQDELGVLTNISREFDYSIGGGVGEPDARLFKEITQTIGFGETTMWYDHIGNIRKTEAEGYSQKVFSFSNYTAEGRLKLDTDPFFGTSVNNINKYDYDEFGRVTSMHQEDQVGMLINSVSYFPMTHTGIVVPYNYTNRTIINSVQRADGVFSSISIDASGKKISSTDNGGTVTYSYLSNNNLKNTAVDGLITSEMKYDDYGFQKSLKELNSGITNYTYNIIGELENQKDSKGNSITMHYDELGRLFQKKTSEGVFDYIFSNDGNSIGSLILAEAPNGFKNEYVYNFNGLLTNEMEWIDGNKYETQFTYNSIGQLNSEKYQTGSLVEFNYTNLGFTEKVFDYSGNSNVDYFIGLGQNEFGAWTSYNLLDGVTSSKTFNVGSQLSSINAPGIYERAYDFDLINGNLNNREDLISGNIEVFKYDPLDRLEKIDLNGNNLMNLSYLQNGNIKSKTDVGNYSYHPSKKHAVTSIKNPNGAITSTTQTIEFDPQHNPKTIEEDGIEWHLEYGPYHQRKRATIIDNNAGTTKTRIYTQNTEYEIDNNGDKTSVEYISGGDGLCGMKVMNASIGLDESYAVYKDYLGSIEVLTNQSGTIVAEQSFDSWGRYRDPNSGLTSTSFLLNKPKWLWRGYTGHEHLEEFQLINMNGRMYDPYLGRMLSPDNFVQAPNSTQNYNRYSYVMNNPLKYTDPDGEAIVTAIIIGGLIGGYTGGATANGSYDLTKWDYQSNNTWSSISGGVLVGAATGGLAFSVATSGIALANTASIVTSSYINSVGMAVVTNGQTDISIGFGIGSYNLTQGEFGYLGKKENSSIENIGYGLGALANASDILAGFKPGSVELRTENDPNYSKSVDENGRPIIQNDKIGHSQLTDGKGNTYVDWGPNQRMRGYMKSVRGTNSYENGIVSSSKMRWNALTIDGVNSNRISNWNPSGKYNLCFNSCVTQTSRALNSSGVFNVGIHPYVLHGQMYLRSIGVRPYLFSAYLYQY